MTGGLAELTDKRAELRALLFDYTQEHPAVQGLQQEITELKQNAIPALC